MPMMKSARLHGAALVLVVALAGCRPDGGPTGPQADPAAPSVGRARPGGSGQHGASDCGSFGGSTGDGVDEACSKYAISERGGGGRIPRSR